MVWDWGKYLGQEALEQGVDVCVSSWTRMAPNTLPAMAKSAGNYMNSQLIKVEAVKGGFAEGIALDAQGLRLGGQRGEPLRGRRRDACSRRRSSPRCCRASLATRVLTLARRLGIPIEEKALPREMLYLADELFFTGTAAEITPIRSVDRHTVGAGARGPVTAALQKAFFDVIDVPCARRARLADLRARPHGRGPGRSAVARAGGRAQCTSTTC